MKPQELDIILIPCSIFSEDMPAKISVKEFDSPVDFNFTPFFSQVAMCKVVIGKEKEIFISTVLLVSRII